MRTLARYPITTAWFALVAVATFALELRGGR